MMQKNSSSVGLLIVEDEVHNSRMLKDLINRLRPGWTILEVLESVEDTVNWLSQNGEPDLIMMDIQLSDGICFSVFEKIKISHHPCIIFTTAYDEYAIRAFKVNSIDYLLKPVDERELEQAFKKFEVQQQTKVPFNQGQEHYLSLIDSVLNGRKEYRKRFLISGIQSYQKLETRDIAYIFSDNKLTFAVDAQGKQHTLDYNLEQLELELDPEQFFRVNRKIIVNVDAIIKVSNETGQKLKVFVEPAPGFDVMVSRLKAADFKNWLGK